MRNKAKNVENIRRGRTLVRIYGVATFSDRAIYDVQSQFSDVPSVLLISSLAYAIPFRRPLLRAECLESVVCQELSGCDRDVLLETDLNKSFRMCRRGFCLK
jgi:hypothetical protein